MSKLETLKLTQREFDQLPEYSASLPTGTTVGKRWKRHWREPQSCGVPSSHPAYRHIPPKDGWQIGEYVEHPDPGLVGIKWYEVELVTEAMA